MRKFMTFLEEKISPLAEKLDRNRYLQAIRNGFLLAMPLIIIGSIFLLFAFIPIGGYDAFMAGLLGDGWQDIFLQVYSSSFAILNLFVILGIAYNLAAHYKIDKIFAATVALSSYLVLLVFDNGAISLSDLGAESLFLGMISAILSVEIQRIVIEKKWVIKLPETVPSNIANSFSSLIPAFMSLMAFNIIRLILKATTFGTVGNLIFSLVQAPLTKLGNTLPAFLVFVFAEMLFWSLGMHGSNIVGSITTPILTALTAENAAAVAAGLAPTNIINAQFLGNFVRLGGAGAHLGVVLLCLFYAKSKTKKTLGKLALGPIIFQINEPVIFGFPMVLNPIMMIPFILCPIIIAITCYFAMSSGLVPVTNGANLPWTTPPLVSGFLLCGWRGFLLQAFCLFESILIYFPFFKVEDKNSFELEQGEEEK